MFGGSGGGGGGGGDVARRFERKSKYVLDALYCAECWERSGTLAETSDTRTKERKKVSKRERVYTD